jgi:hypothetical protein
MKIWVYFTFGANLTHRTADAAERNEHAEITALVTSVSLHTLCDIIQQAAFQGYHLILVYSVIQSCPQTEMLLNNLTREYASKFWMGGQCKKPGCFMPGNIPTVIKPRSDNTFDPNLSPSQNML